MNNLIQSFTVLNRSLERPKVLNKVSTEFEVFKNNFLTFKKEIDRPDDYYFEDDLITYLITLKNEGTKNISNFTLRDDAPSNIAPLANGYYEVLTTNGAVSFEEKEIVISNITLKPQEELQISITGRVKSLEKDYEEDIMF